MAMNLTKIFYGSSYVGFEIMKDIDPILGPPLMFIFVTLSSILLMGSLTGKLIILSLLPHQRRRKGKSNKFGCSRYALKLFFPRH
jgi:hypothetical protein